MSTRVLAAICAILAMAMPALAQTNSPTRTYTLPITFTLTDSATTSAGVFKTDGTLVRTLWSNVPYAAGTHNEKWDGLDDAGSVVPSAGYQVKILTNNVKYEWEGVIGNNSSSSTGSGVHKTFQFMNAMTIAGNKAFYAAHYNEAYPSQYKFNTTNPQKKRGYRMGL